jgi:hypothetical protein
MLCEDENDKLSVCDNALIHENPLLLLKYHVYTIEEKHVYVEKYLHGLQLSYAYGKSSCSHDVIIKSATSNYFERESMLMYPLINLMILFICHNSRWFMIQVVTLLTFLQVSAVIMKEED